MMSLGDRFLNYPQLSYERQTQLKKIVLFIMDIGDDQL